MAQGQRDWAKDFEELNNLIKGEKWTETITYCDTSMQH